ncbi:MAG: MATE family efflux transporter [Clostridiaceae bacterium]|nr:MATE family efflux transporter [Clostridiaceae bacterium]
MERTLYRSAWQRFKGMFLGDRKFYSVILALVLPIIVQNTVSNFVNLLDNVMVGSLGTTELSGVAIANQLIFVFNLSIFGAISGAGIYGAQFVGASNWEGLRQSFRFKLLVATGITAIGMSVLYFAADPLISLYLTGEGDAADAAAMLANGKSYLRIMVWGLLPFALTQTYSGTLRETGHATLPMVSSLAAVLVNLTFNYLLIFGHFGFPRLGIQGAAIATLMSRYVELGVVVIWTHTHHLKYFFMEGVYRSFRIGRKLALQIAAKSLPLLANEFLWSLSMTTLIQILSTRGLNVMAGLNIASTITNLFNVFFLSMGTAVAVTVGQSLGANDLVKAKGQVWKIIFFDVCVCIVLGSVLASVAGLIPRIYNTTDEVRHLATTFMRTSAMYMAFNATAHCCYFALRSGGKTFITFLFDSVYSWAIMIPYVYLLVHHTGLPITALYPLANLADAIKAIVGVLVVRTGYWARNIVSDAKPAEPPELLAEGG